MGRDTQVQCKEPLPTRADIRCIVFTAVIELQQSQQFHAGFGHQCRLVVFWNAHKLVLRGAGLSNSLWGHNETNPLEDAHTACSLVTSISLLCFHRVCMAYAGL